MGTCTFRYVSPSPDSAKARLGDTYLKVHVPYANNASRAKLASQCSPI